MSIHLTTPSTIRLVGYEEKRAALEAELTYTDKRKEFEYQKARKSNFLIQKLGHKAYEEHLKELKSQIKKCLLFQDDQGLWTYSGFSTRLAKAFDDQVSEENLFPKHDQIPWQNTPNRTLRPYQEEAVHLLLERRHGAVEIGTGLGKTAIIEALVKEIGLKAVVMAPSKSIASQIHKEFEYHFGKKRVGYFGDGKKDFKKLIVVAIAASLTKVQEGSPAWKELSKAQVFVADESHLTPAATLQKVCFGLMSEVPYRFFFSGTQLRNDGLGLLLEAITGDIVFRMSVREGVDQGYLAKPIFKMFGCKSDSDFESRDVNAMTRAHFYYNQNVINRVANLANMSVEILGRPTLILIDEMEQFARLLPKLHHKFGFAHGPITKQNKDKIPARFHESDPNRLVDDFNAGKFKLLIGTSCISTGTDIKVASHIINWVGGKSEIQIKQGVGRGTRLCQGKVDCFVTDFDVENVDVLSRHAEERCEVYDSIYGPVTRIGV